MKIKWIDEIAQAEKISISEIISRILKNRRIKDIQSFLSPIHPQSMRLADFGFKKELIKTLDLLTAIHKKGETIVVYTDYDADGITGGTIMWETLYLLGFNVMPYVPQRKQEGYGFSIKGIDRVKKEFNPALIISVDHGITGIEQIAYTASLGIKVIVTDHHLKSDTLPKDAYAIFHVPEFSGSGVAYMIAKEISIHFGPSSNNRDKVSTYFKHDYLALAAIGTIADLVPLTGPSRSIVYHGLKAFKHITRKGIAHIIKEAQIPPDKEITPYEIGFIIAPRINAVGRLEHALDALRLLCTHNDKQAYEIASRVGDTNRKRQDMVTEAVKQADQMVKHMIEDHTLPLLIFLEREDWNEGIIGLIASKIAEKYSRPTIVMTKSDGFYKGSARSINEFHITEFLRKFKKILISVGGHKGAAGFSVLESQKKNLLKKMESQMKKDAREADFEKIITSDLKIPLTHVNLRLAKEIKKLAPFGMGNPHPVLLSDVRILDKKLFGKKHEHVKFYAKDLQKDSFPMEFISFFTSDGYKDVEKGQSVSMVYTLDINRWNGKETVRGKINQLIKPILF